MKRIALLGFIVFLVPVIFTACDPCSQSLKDYPKFRTYSKIENQIFKPVSMNVYLDNDTIVEDTILLKIEFTSNYFSSLKKPNYCKNYSLMACEPAEPRERNILKKFLFGLAINEDTQNLNKALLQSMEFNIYGSHYIWPKDEKNFLNYFVHQEQDYLGVSFPSPHNSKYIQFVTWAIKENGDTLKAISQKVFCR
jgi:hypothetical protein